MDITYIFLPALEIAIGILLFTWLVSQISFARDFLDNLFDTKIADFSDFQTIVILALVTGFFYVIEWMRNYYGQLQGLEIALFGMVLSGVWRELVAMFWESPKYAKVLCTISVGLGIILWYFAPAHSFWRWIVLSLIAIGLGVIYFQKPKTEKESEENHE